MSEPLPYFRDLERVVGDKTPDDKISFNFNWTDHATAKRAIADIRHMQKEIRLLKKRATSDLVELRSQFTSAKTAIGKGVGSAVSGILFGRKLVGSMNALQRDNSRIAQRRATAPYEAVKGIMDQVLARLDTIKLGIELSPAYQVGRVAPKPILIEQSAPITTAVYWAYLDNAVKGPFSRDQLAGLLTAHVADDTTLVCLDGTEDWKGFYEIPELAELLP